MSVGNTQWTSHSLKDRFVLVARLHAAGRKQSLNTEELATLLTTRGTTVRSWFSGSGLPRTAGVCARIRAIVDSADLPLPDADERALADQLVREYQRHQRERLATRAKARRAAQAPVPIRPAAQAPAPQPSQPVLVRAAPAPAAWLWPAVTGALAASLVAALAALATR
jgi:hypothetical protein